jgi:hypothetical protein
VATDEPNHRMDFHEATITPITGKDGMTGYDLTVIAGSRTSHRLNGTLESVIEALDPPLSARVGSHIVEGVRDEGKPVVFLRGRFARRAVARPKDMKKEKHARGQAQSALA